jgi:flagellar protein FlaJ
MISSASWQKRIARIFSEEITSAELFYQLTYMSATAASGLSRDKVFELAAAAPCRAAAAFARVRELVHDLQYDYPLACRLVGQHEQSADMRSFLLRLANALEGGERLDEFLAAEAAVQGEHYTNQYERDVESLKKWTEAYSSLIISEALIVIINLISTMIYALGTTMMAALMSVAVAMSFFGAWVLTRAAPKETMIVHAPEGSAIQIRSRRLLRVLAPLSVVIGGGLALAGAGWGWSLLAAAVIMAPLGWLSQKADKGVARMEAEGGSFLRTLGGMATSAGSTLSEALTKIDRESFPALKQSIATLTLRLSARISPELCWQRFGYETGSQLLSETSRIFFDAVNLGGDPDEVSALCSMFTNKTALLRAKRRVVAETFSWLTLVMHGCLALLLIIVLEIVFRFRQMIEAAVEPGQAEEAMSALNIPLLSFAGGKLEFLQQMTVAMVILFAVVDTAAIVASDGGFRPKAFYYLALLLVISSVCFFTGPSLIAAIM